MKAEEWERIKRLFDVALSLPPDQRQRWLDQACASEPDLCATLTELLQAYDEEEEDPYDFGSIPVFSKGQVVAEHFKVVRRISGGGQGEVYEVIDLRYPKPHSEIRRALKTLRFDLANDAAALDRFRREVLVAQEVSDHTICRVFDLVEHRDPARPKQVVLCLTMQLLTGRPLVQEIREHRPFSPQKCLHIVKQIVRALGIMHSHGIAHRDVRPGNIMLLDEPGAEAPRAVVMDFGLAKRIGPRSKLWNQANSEQGGAPYFVAPEVLQGSEGGIPVDIYGLGLLIDEMITQRPAFPQRSVWDLLLAKTQEDPVPPSARSKNLPAGWEDLILWCIQREPEARPPSVGAVLARLRLPDSAPLKATRERRQDSSDTSFWTRRRALIAAGVAAAGGLPLAATLLHRETSGRIVIRAFANATGDDSLEHLWIGAVAEVKRRLLGVGDVRVYELRGAPTSLPRMEGPVYFLDGALEGTPAAPRMAIALTLARTGETVWTKEFDELSDLLAFQDGLVADILDTLQHHSSWSEQLLRWPETMLREPASETRLAGLTNTPSPPPTQMESAQRLYSIGLSLLAKRTPRTAREAIRKFEAATRIDPRHALAWAALADAQQVLITYNIDDTQTLLAVARQYIHKALEADPNLAEVQLSAAAVYQMAFDWEAAETAYRRAIELSPRLARAKHWFAGLILQFGRFDEAIQLSREGIRADPFDIPSHSAHGLFLWYAGRAQEAIAHERKLLERADLLYAHVVLGQVEAHLAKEVMGGDATQHYLEALEEGAIIRQKELDAHGLRAADYLKWSDLVFVQAHAARGDLGAADKYLRRLQTGYSKQRISAGALAKAHAAMGDYENALSLLETALEQQDREMLYLRVHPLFAPLKGKPRYEKLLREMRLV